MAIGESRPGRKKVVPPELAERMSFAIDPAVREALEVQAWKDGIRNISVWLHQHFCPLLGLEDRKLEDFPDTSV